MYYIFCGGEILIGEPGRAVTKQTVQPLPPPPKNVTIGCLALVSIFRINIYILTAGYPNYIQNNFGTIRTIFGRINGQISVSRCGGRISGLNTIWNIQSQRKFKHYCQISSLTGNLVSGNILHSRISRKINDRTSGSQ